MEFNLGFVISIFEIAKIMADFDYDYYLNDEQHEVVMDDVKKMSKSLIFVNNIAYDTTFMSEDNKLMLNNNSCLTYEFINDSLSLNSYSITLHVSLSCNCLACENFKLLEISKNFKLTALHQLYGLFILTVKNQFKSIQNFEFLLKKHNIKIEEDDKIDIGFKLQDSITTNVSPYLLQTINEYILNIKKIIKLIEYLNLSKHFYKINLKKLIYTNLKFIFICKK